MPLVAGSHMINYHLRASPASCSRGSCARTRYSQEKRWADFPNVTFNFDCTDRPIGFYADVEHDCMVSAAQCRVVPALLTAACADIPHV